MVLASGRAHGQVVRYKEANSPKLWTVAEVDTFTQVMNRRGKSAGWLINTNLTAAGLLLSACCFVDLGAVA
ncbi:MAG: hypothetical protein EOP49_43750, partial [Sphingobacteriales bacterium]